MTTAPAAEGEARAGGPQPLHRAPPASLAAITTVATDVDGTLTAQGRLAGDTLRDLAALGDAGITVILVTGRSAGWSAALAAYVPGVAGVVAENGAVWIDAEAEAHPVLLDERSRSGDAPALSAADAALDELRSRLGPVVQAAADNFCRLTDRTLLTDPAIPPGAVAEVAARFGLTHTYSTVHHHLSTSTMTKQTGLLAVVRGEDRLAARCPTPSRHLLTVGDSVNDASLFDATAFAMTVGVAAVRRHLELLGDARPSWITESDGGHGFGEVARAVLSARTSAGVGAHGAAPGDRRAAPRVPVRLPLSLTSHGPEVRAVAGHSVDLSVNGVRAETPVDLGDGVEQTVVIGTGTGALVLRAEIVRTRHVGDRWEHGLLFVDNPEGDVVRLAGLCADAAAALPQSTS